MKIKQKELSYDEFIKLPPGKHREPKKPAFFFRWLLKTLSAGELKAVRFTHTEEGMEKLKKDEPALVLMNHSSFIDLKIASTLLYPRAFNIVTTMDGFVGKDGLMRAIGCIPTRKFITDPVLIRDMLSAKKRGDLILMYPEASYSFDGTATPLPESLGKCLKLLKIPVIMIRTRGAFLRDPLYNGLQLRDVKVSAEMKYLLSPEDIAGKPVSELNGILREAFSFDYFREQQEEGVRVAEPFRADGLNRVLYKCPVCGAEGRMTGAGTELICSACGAKWTLTEDGFLKAVGREDVFTHVPDWYRWEREEVRKEIESGAYKADIPVRIAGLKDTDCLYFIGEGTLHHDRNGFRLSGCGGKLDFKVAAKAQYSLYSDYFWYEIGDMISVGDTAVVYYCFPTDGRDVAAKTRLAAEEIYKLEKESSAEAGARTKRG